MQEVISWIRVFSLLAVGGVAGIILVVLIIMAVEKWQLKKRYRIKRKWKKQSTKQ